MLCYYAAITFIWVNKPTKCIYFQNMRNNSCVNIIAYLYYIYYPPMYRYLINYIIKYVEYKTNKIYFVYKYSCT